MEPTDELTGDDAMAAAALRALSPLLCTGCGTEIDRTINKIGKLRCLRCGRGHCPLCERSASDACKHQIAYSEPSGSRDFPGVMDAHYEAPWLPVKYPFLLAFPTEEQHAAFGSAADLVEKLCGATLIHKSDSQALFLDLLRHVAGDGEVVSSNGRSGNYFFARDPEVARTKARQVLRNLEAGFAHLRASRPPTSLFLERVLPLARRHPLYEQYDKFHNGGYFCFAPGPVPRLAYATWRKIVLWRLDSNAPPKQISLPDKKSCIKGLRFTSDGARIGVRTPAPPADEPFNVEAPDTPTGTTWLWDCETGELVGSRQSWSVHDGAKGAELLSSDTRYYRLHGGASEMTVDGGTIRIASRVPPQPDEEHLQNGSSEIIIKLRGFIVHAAIAPDGDSFAVIHGAQDGTQILFFRVPPDAVHGPNRTVGEEHK